MDLRRRMKKEEYKRENGSKKKEEIEKENSSDISKEENKVEGKKGT
jgi:hypothetical protein